MMLGYLTYLLLFGKLMVGIGLLLKLKKEVAVINIAVVIGALSL